MLVIDPDTCIDCEACVPACPVNAIYADYELPDEYAEWEDVNAEKFESGTNLVDSMEPLPEARFLDEIQAEEQSKGWDILEPGKAS